MSLHGSASNDRPPTAATRKGSGFPVRAAAKLAVSVAVLSWLAYIIDWPGFGVVMSLARVDLLVLAAILQVLSNLAVTWRWQLLMVPVGIRVRFLQALQSYLKGHFAAYFIPSGVTGDVVKALDLHDSRRHSADRRGVELASSIFIERGFGAITVGMAVVLGISLSPLTAGPDGIQAVLVLASVIVIGCSLVALHADRFLHWIPNVLRRRSDLIDAVIERAEVSFRAYRQLPGLLTGILAQSIGIQLLRVMIVYVIAVAVGAGDQFLPYLIAVPVIFLANMIPVIGSRIGSEQGLFVLFLGLAGVSPEAAMAVALISLVLGVISALPGGYWLLRGRKARPQPLADE